MFTGATRATGKKVKRIKSRRFEGSEDVTGGAGGGEGASEGSE